MPAYCHATSVNGPGLLAVQWRSVWTIVTVPTAGATGELDFAPAAPGGTITWAFGRSTGSTGVVRNLTVRNG